MQATQDGELEALRVGAVGALALDRLAHQVEPLRPQRRVIERRQRVCVAQVTN